MIIDLFQPAAFQPDVMQQFGPGVYVAPLVGGPWYIDALKARNTNVAVPARDMTVDYWPPTGGKRG